MTPTTEAVRERGFLTVECDIPAGMTIAEYRRRRARRLRASVRRALTRARAGR
jgi:hypothetical protein